MKCANTAEVRLQRLVTFLMQPFHMNQPAADPFCRKFCSALPIVLNVLCAKKIKPLLITFTEAQRNMMVSDAP